MASGSDDLTQLLKAWSSGDENALEQLTQRVYTELQRVARDLVALDEALRRLAQIDPRKTNIVELRFFGGLSVAEIAMVLKVSDRTVLREWNVAKAWLHREISGAEVHDART